jgi:hypothetical protein
LTYAIKKTYVRINYLANFSMRTGILSIYWL